MSINYLDRRTANVVLIVDDVPENLAVLHDALDESGYTVLVANHGKAALERAAQALPDIILLDVLMPGMDGLEVCRRLKESLLTRHIPVIFMTGLTEAEHVVSAFEAGGTDYVTKPIRTVEVLARISAHMVTAGQMHQARNALDAFGNAMFAITPQDGKIVWQTPLARQWLHTYFDADALHLSATAPAIVMTWLTATQQASTVNQRHADLMIVQGAKRLLFSVADMSSTEQWTVVLKEESDAAQIEAMMLIFKLTQRESEVLNWVIKGKTNRDIGEILGTSPRTINKHLEHVFIKLGVETRTSAASLVMSKIRAIKPEQVML